MEKETYKLLSCNLYRITLIHSLLFCLCTACCLTDSKSLKHKIEHSEKDIIYRAVALLAVGAKGYGSDNFRLSDFTEKYPLIQYLTEDEYLFICDETYNSKHSDAPRFYEYKWRTESACTLLWAIGYFDELKVDNPGVPCEVSSVLNILENSDKAVRNINIRPLSEILAMANLYKGYELSTRSARIIGQEDCVDSSLIDPAIVFWRYLALKWLLGMDDW
jgi:hypothetical protein